MKINLDELTNLTLTECDVKSPLDLHVHGAHDYSRLKGLWLALWRKPTARPIVITNNHFTNSAYMPGLKGRVKAAWRCLTGYVPDYGDTACLMIHHDGDES